MFDRFGYYNDNLDPDSPFGAGAAAGGGGPGGFDFSGFDFSGSTRTSGGSSFRDIFSDLFGGGGGARAEPEPPRAVPKRGRDIEIPLALPFAGPDFEDDGDHGRYSLCTTSKYRIRPTSTEFGRRGPCVRPRTIARFVPTVHVRECPRQNRRWNNRWEVLLNDP